MLLKLKEKLISACKNSSYVFKREIGFYMVAAIVLVGITFFSYICGTSAKMNEISSQNQNLAADKAALEGEVADKNGQIADKDAEIADQNAELAEKDAQIAEKDAALQDSEKNNEALENAIADILVTYNSRSGSQHYTSVDQINQVEYAIRSIYGETEQTAEYLAQLADMKADAEYKLAHFPDYDPLEHGTLTSRFGYRNDPNGAGTKYHNGIDVWNQAGTPIYAAGAGTVINAGDMGAYGLCVIIDHGNGYQGVYAHCSKLLVSVGETVEKGQNIARVGATGNATGNHLHYELKIDGERVNPIDYVFPQFS